MRGEINRREFLGRSLKTGLALAIPTTLTRKVRANTIEYTTGKLYIYNEMDRDYGFDIIGLYRIIHYEGGTDGLDQGKDMRYSNPPGSWTKATKIVSIIPGYELVQDARPLNSFTPINLELAIHTKSGSSITVSNLQNELWLSMPLAGDPYFYDFGVKPITLWRRNIIDPNENPNDPNNYTISFMADIRELIVSAKLREEEAIIPLPNLNGEYQSQVPYDYLQVRFDVYPGDLDLNGIVDAKDLAHLGEDWGKQAQPLEFLGDITGERGLPDGQVDKRDLELLTRYWLKEIKDIMP